MPVKTGRDNISKFARTIRDLTLKQVMVGIPAEGADRRAEPEEKAPPTNAAIGYWMEYGVPEKNIPERPFLTPGIEDAAPLITPVLEKAAREALAGGDVSVDQAMHTVGLICQNSVRAKITDGPFTPLSKRTLAARRARGREGDKPLLDTGQLRQSVTYVVRTGKGEKISRARSAGLDAVAEALGVTRD